MLGPPAAGADFASLTVREFYSTRAFPRFLSFEYSLEATMKPIACLVTAALLLSSVVAFVEPVNAQQNIRPLAPSQDTEVPVTSAVVQDSSPDPELTKHFRRFDVMKFDRQAAAMQVRNRGRLILKTSHGNFDLAFTPNDLRSADYSAQEISADGIAHKLPMVWSIRSRLP